MTESFKNKKECSDCIKKDVEGSISRFVCKCIIIEEQKEIKTFDVDYTSEFDNNKNYNEYQISEVKRDNSEEEKNNMFFECEKGNNECGNINKNSIFGSLFTNIINQCKNFVSPAHYKRKNLYDSQNSTFKTKTKDLCKENLHMTDSKILYENNKLPSNAKNEQRKNECIDLKAINSFQSNALSSDTKNVQTTILSTIKKELQQTNTLLEFKNEQVNDCISNIENKDEQINNPYEDRTLETKNEQTYNNTIITHSNEPMNTSIFKNEKDKKINNRKNLNQKNEQIFNNFYESKIYFTKKLFKENEFGRNLFILNFFLLFFFFQTKFLFSHFFYFSQKFYFLFIFFVFQKLFFQISKLFFEEFYNFRKRKIRTKSTLTELTETILISKGRPSRLSRELSSYKDRVLTTLAMSNSVMDGNSNDDDSSDNLMGLILNSEELDIKQKKINEKVKKSLFLDWTTKNIIKELKKILNSFYQELMEFDLKKQFSLYLQLTMFTFLLILTRSIQRVIMCVILFSFENFSMNSIQFNSLQHVSKFFDKFALFTCKNKFLNIIGRSIQNFFGKFTVYCVNDGFVGSFLGSIQNFIFFPTSLSNIYSFLYALYVSSKNYIRELSLCCKNNSVFDLIIFLNYLFLVTIIYMKIKKISNKNNRKKSKETNIQYKTSRFCFIVFIYIETVLLFYPILVYRTIILRNANINDQNIIFPLFHSLTMNNFLTFKIFYFYWICLLGLNIVCFRIIYRSFRPGLFYNVLKKKTIYQNTLNYFFNQSILDFMKDLIVFNFLFSILINLNLIIAILSTKNIKNEILMIIIFILKNKTIEKILKENLLFPISKLFSLENYLFGIFKEVNSANNLFIVPNSNYKNNKIERRINNNKKNDKVNLLETYKKTKNNNHYYRICFIPNQIKKKILAYVFINFILLIASVFTFIKLQKILSICFMKIISKIYTQICFLNLLTNENQINIEKYPIDLIISSMLHNMIKNSFTNLFDLITPTSLCKTIKDTFINSQATLILCSIGMIFTKFYETLVSSSLGLIIIDIFRKIIYFSIPNFYINTIIILLFVKLIKKYSLILISKKYSGYFILHLIFDFTHFITKVFISAISIVSIGHIILINLKKKQNDVFYDLKEVILLGIIYKIIINILLKYNKKQREWKSNMKYTLSTSIMAIVLNSIKNNHLLMLSFVIICYPILILLKRKFEIYKK